MLPNISVEDALQILQEDMKCDDSNAATAYLPQPLTPEDRINIKKTMKLKFEETFKTTCPQVLSKLMYYFYIRSSPLNHHKPIKVEMNDRREPQVSYYNARSSDSIRQSIHARQIQFNFGRPPTIFGTYKSIEDSFRAGVYDTKKYASIIISMDDLNDLFVDYHIYFRGLLDNPHT